MLKLDGMTYRLSGIDAAETKKAPTVWHWL